GILLADPSGKGFINPNAPPAEEGVPGLEDLGKGFSISLEEKIQNSNRRNEGRKKIFSYKTGLSDWDKPSEDDEEGKESVTAPGQPIGPIVGVVSLWDLASFKRYHEQENYTEWTFSIFDLLDQQQQQNTTKAGAPAPTSGFGVGPGGNNTLMGGQSCCGPQCPPGSRCGDRVNPGSNAAGQ
ncbi:MAG: hypothetical protein L0170_13515, partial [Acidobacteria bacterium]|nr:hypothetical protein [Acidobacteriota bacterium]